MEEDTGLPYSSEVPGMMHVCGHDMHVAMLLVTAKILCQMREEFAGTVKLIFQHSEDTMPGGAKELVEKGVLENVDAIVGMYILMQTGLEKSVSAPVCLQLLSIFTM